MSLLKTLRGLNRLEDAQKAAKGAQEFLEIADKQLKAAHASGWSGDGLKALEKQMEEAQKLRDATREAVESFGKTAKARMLGAGGAGLAAGGVATTYESYQIGYGRGQNNLKRDEHGREVPVSFGGKIKQAANDAVNPPNGGPPAIGIGTLLGAGLLGAVGFIFGQGEALIAIVLALVGAIGGQAVMNSLSSPIAATPDSANSATPPGKPAETSATDVNPQARTNAGKTNDIMASVTTDALGALPKQGLPQMADTKQKQANPLKAPSGNSGIA